jgi:hypothetical protein
MNLLQSGNNKRNNSSQAQATTNHVRRTRELRWLRARHAGRLDIRARRVRTIMRRNIAGC